MEKYRFEKEFEIKASPRMLYPYLLNPEGLSQWFADDVKVLPDGNYLFEWEGERHSARVVSRRLNKHVKFVFTDSGDDEIKANFVEFFLDYNDIIGSTFLKVVDFSEMDDEEELHKLWDGLVQSLKEIVGG
ncbi:uncharacterized protein YndB with AHSA1/START domain [Thermonema lapsum]|jgi:uncharacterized protein YndB with AHSA1/START domain|uniref:Uncharacterized protein YndB with AHSA1/START domain n=1 Tax=Thermonema lapsum TaxID=28195 RepID=A0A846MR76_9BACT|nr:START-like domain-containing protein [Thermonema lapsum]NIK73767.1 uncharacterized protein YndB with AHSA1/START domain [Thermonema lapsum]